MGTRKDDINPFDISIPVFGMPNAKKTTKTKSKCRLTLAQTTKIRNAIGKCEYPGCKMGAQEVHHIKFCNEGGTNAYSNLIVLCGAHHNLAHGKVVDGKIIPKTVLRNLVKKRSKEKEKQVKGIIKSKMATNPKKTNPKSQWDGSNFKW